MNNKMGSDEARCDVCLEIKYIRTSYTCQLCGTTVCDDCDCEWTEVCFDCVEMGIEMYSEQVQDTQQDT